ncbi:MAG: hypothetical protein CVU00_07940 [Bacteroidetes bacterium HGW-Bacteroidetes-17]|jgi:azurin|nr:MAG: hypothetical protein CVU00_07940 [Bacteroidetes bacterium HGW-Bacteroidetes-17]
MKKTLSIAAILLFALAAFSQNKFEQPVLITSAGQSADVKLVQLLAKRQAIEGETKVMAKETDMDGVKTLIIVPGFSSKGLGSAGISQEDEMNRVKELVKTAQGKNIPIVMMHIGGKSRRGGQSDGFCEIIAENCKAMIVVKQGNEDGFFTDIAKKNNIQILEVEKISDAAVPLKELFK